MTALRSYFKWLSHNKWEYAIVTLVDEAPNVSGIICLKTLKLSIRLPEHIATFNVMKLLSFTTFSLKFDGHSYVALVYVNCASMYLRRELQGHWCIVTSGFRHE